MIEYKYMFIDLQLQLTGDLANVRYYAERKQASNTYRATIQMCKHLSEMLTECHKTKQPLEFTQGVLNQNTSDLLKILNDTDMYNIICDYYKIYKGGEMMYTIIEYRYIDKVYYLSKAHYDMTTEDVIKYLKTGIIKKNDCISIYAGLSDEVLTINLLTKTWTRGYTKCDKRLHTFLVSMQEEVEKGGFHIVEHY